MIGVVREFNEVDLRLEALADVGADIEFYNNVLIRFGVALDDVGSDWGIGFAIRR